MAQAKILGRAVVVESTLSYDDIKLAQSIVPSSLKIIDEKTNEVLFVVTPGKEEAINENGAVFSQDNFITMLVPGSKPITKQIVRDLLGNALIKLSTVEKQVAKELPKFEKELDKSITVVGGEA